MKISEEVSSEEVSSEEVSSEKSEEKIEVEGQNQSSGVPNLKRNKTRVK